MNSRGKQHVRLRDVRHRGLAKVRVHAGPSCLVMVAGALGMMQAGHPEWARTVVRLASCPPLTRRTPKTGVSGPACGTPTPARRGPAWPGAIATPFMPLGFHPVAAPLAFPSLLPGSASQLGGSLRLATPEPTWCSATPSISHPALHEFQARVRSPGLRQVAIVQVPGAGAPPASSSSLPPPGRAPALISARIHT